jgi:hypothetical protein
MRIRTAMAAMAVMIVAVIGWGTPAHADLRTIDTDGVKVNEVGFDLGAGAYNNNQLDDNATVEWLVDENDITANVFGILQLSGVFNECARVRIDYYTPVSVWLHDEHGGTVCATTNGQHRWSFDQDDYTSEDVGKVKVSIEILLPNGLYAITGSAWATLNEYIDTTVRVAEADGGGVWGIGFGSQAWGQGNPIGNGEIHWHLSGGDIRMHLLGFLHLESAGGDCVRMRMDYYEDDGPDADALSDYITTDWGGTVCALDNSHHVWSVDQDDYIGTTIRYVKVSIEEQTGPNSWVIRDSTTSYFGT